MAQNTLIITFTVIQILLVFGIMYYIGKLLLISLTVAFCRKPWLSPYVPTRPRFHKHAFQMLNIKPGDRVVDLGSGDAGFLLYGAKRVNAEFVGVEINWFLVVLSYIKSLFSFKKGSVEIVRSDFLNVPLGRYNKIFIFSMPSQMDFLKPKFKKELRKGTLILSVMFPVKATFLKLVETAGEEKYKLFLYEMTG